MFLVNKKKMCFILYFCLLDNQDYSVQTALDNWLDGLGPVIIPEAVAGREKRQISKEKTLRVSKTSSEVEK